MNVLLGISTDATALQIHEIIDAGFEVNTLTALGHLGLIAPGTLEAIVPLQSLKMKLASGERLTASQSDDLFRLAHAIALAEFFLATLKRLCAGCPNRNLNSREKARLICSRLPSDSVR